MVQVREASAKALRCEWLRELEEGAEEPVVEAE